ncbi:MAG TPA: FlgD immunoglobulin-like domain containing protein, partial [bacterium]
RNESSYVSENNKIEFQMHNYPNPFNPETIIKFQLPQPCKVALKIYNPLGQEIRTLVDEQRSAGYHEIKWDGKDNSSTKVGTGIYIYQLKADDFVAVKKMIMIQ